MRISLHFLDGIGSPGPLHLFSISIGIGQSEEEPGTLQAVYDNLLAHVKGIQMALADLVREVAESRSVTEGAVAFIKGLKDQIQALKDHADDADALNQAVDGLTADLDAQQKNISDAMSAGTAADPAQPPPDNGVAAAPNVDQPPPVAEVVANAEATDTATAAAPNV